MPTNIVNSMITLPNTTASRSLGDHLSGSVNVRSFVGVLGDGVNDDTVGIQNAVNYACSNGKLLLFPQANPGQFYNISNQIQIPAYNLNWAIRGTGHRVNIKQLTDNKPFIHFDSLTVNGSGLTNGGFDIANFAVTWANNQPVTNTHAAVIEFNDGGYADYVIENMENVNGCRCITHQYPGQTVGRQLNTWGCIYRHLYNAFAASGAILYLRSNPVEGLPNILIEHIYSVQNAAGEELIHIAGGSNITIINVEQNFGSYTPGMVAWGGSGNIAIFDWRVEEWDWLDGGGAQIYFNFAGPGSPALPEFHIYNFEMRFADINLTSPKYLIQTNGCRVFFNGYLETATNWIAGQLNLFSLSASVDVLEVGLSTIINPHVQFCNPSESFLGNVTFTGGSRAIEFYKNSLTASMTAVINDDGSNIKAKTVGQTGWIWSMVLELDVAVTGGSITATLYKNNAILDSGNFAVTLTSGVSGKHFNGFLKNSNNPSYQVFPGDQLDVRITTSGTFAGPFNAKIVTTIANI